MTEMIDAEIETLVIGVRADIAGFTKDIGAMQNLLDGPLASGMTRAGSLLSSTLSQAIRRGSLDFEDLRRVALSVIADIADAALNSGLSALLGGGNKGLLGLGTSVLGSLLGAPGRAAGGPVTGGRAYRVGEQGPELFVPSGSGRIEPNGGDGTTNIKLTINISDNGQGSAPEQMRRSSRQVARAMRNALAYRMD